MNRLSPPSQQLNQELIGQLIVRPLEQRLREHKYRCAQSIVFGMPVLVLQKFGSQLGGPEAARWVAMLQMILSGWIVYIAATGLISEGVIVLLTRRRLTMDFLVGIAALLIELASIVAAVFILLGRVAPIAPKFHVVAMLLIVWGGLQWFALSLRLKLIAPDAAPAKESAD